MKKLISLMLAVVMVVGLVACGNQGTTAAETTKAAAETGKISGKLEVAAFSNGDLNDQYWQAAKEEFNKLYPDVEVTLILSANIEESMRPRFVADNPPDVYYMGGQANADIAPLTAEGKLLDLSEWYNSVEAIGYDGLLKDNMATAMLNRYNGGIYGMGTTYGVWACLYNKKMLEEHGWKLPNNWQEFEALAAEIKATTDIYPIIHQGQYPDYMGYGLMQGGIATDGGKDLLVKMGNLDVSAFDDPAVVSAYKKYEEIRENDWAPEYCLSMSHTESQLMWLQGKALFLPCGNWLAGEMADSLPEGFEIGLFPTFWHDKDETPAMIGSGAYTVIPAAAKNPEAAKAFMQVLFSKTMIRKAAELGRGIPTMKDDLDGQKLDDESQQVLDLANAGKVNVIFEIGGAGNFEPYGEMRTAIKNAIAAILSGEKDAKTALEEIKTEIERIKNDESITKVTISVS
ncbi:MAG: extracellular solute-binding protein [Eubacteriales bacterium]|nr:extracellular solute-binding protein [Eubacteriales bacterium]